MKLVLSRRASVVLVVLAALLIAAPLALPGIDGKFSGTDDAASAVIEASRPDYHRWMSPFWMPPSKEVESVLFAIEAALGAGLLGYVLGRMHRKRERDVSDR